MNKKYIITRSFYERSAVEVARDLIGKKIVRTYSGQIISGIIVETEAYGGAFDEACHAYRGQTPRNCALFGPRGHSYVYISYGIHHCLNIVSRDQETRGGGVLIRALIPVDGVEIVQSLRKRDESLFHLMNGPGKVGQALQLSVAHNHIDVTKEGELYVTEGLPIVSTDIKATPRIGISKSTENLWRFILKKEKYRNYFPG